MPAVMSAGGEGGSKTRARGRGRGGAAPALPGQPRARRPRRHRGRARSPRRARRSKPRPRTSFCSTFISATRTGSSCSTRSRRSTWPPGSCSSRARARSGRSSAPASAACSASRSRSRASTPWSAASPSGSLGTMSTAAVRTPAQYEERLASYVFERSEEARAVRVGEKETSEQAAIVERYRDLFTPEQLEVLREAEAGRGRRRARAALPAAEDLRVRDRLRRARRAGGRAREPDSRGARRVGRGGAAAALRAGEARRPPRVRRPGRAGPARDCRDRPFQRGAP